MKLIKKTPVAKPVKKKDVKEHSVKRTKVKDDALSTAERYIGYMSKNLASVQSNALFVAGQMKDWPNKEDRQTVRMNMTHIRDVAQDVVAALDKAIKMI